jgi:hypothetical protein
MQPNHKKRRAVMKNTNQLTKFLAVPVLFTILVGCSPLDQPPGKYEHSSSATDSSGTTTESKQSTTVGYDQYGNKKAVIKSEKSRDPAGLFNKTTSSSEEVLKDK